MRYVQIEKEMLSIVHACVKFHNYIFGNHVTVYNDHKPLEDIFRKLLLSTPMRIQRMRFRLQWYDLTVKYRRGKDMELPDTLSRAQLPENKPWKSSSVSPCSTLFQSVSRNIQSSRTAQTRCSCLQQTIRQGWPDRRCDVPNAVQTFWDSQSQLVVADGVVYKGLCIVVPPSMREHMLKLIH